MTTTNNDNFNTDIEELLLGEDWDDFEYDPDPAELLYDGGKWRESDEITSRMMCGGDAYLAESVYLGRLRDFGVTHILDCRSLEEIEFYKYAKLASTAESLFTIEHNPTHDDGKPKEVAYFERAVKWGRKVLADPEARIYVHCAMGINRGPSNLLAIICDHLNVDVEIGMRLIRGARPAAAMNYWVDVEVALKEIRNGR